MKFKEIEGLTEAELVSKKNDFRSEFLNLKLQQVSGQLEKPSRLREIRRTAARIETVLTRKRALAKAGAADSAKGQS
jgi:large subunit ribosomal protein L29